MTSTTDTVTESRTPRLEPLREGDKAMFRARLRNALFDELRSLFRRRKKEEGIKQKDIAARLDVDPGTVSRRLKGEENVSLDWVSDIARAMDARVEVHIRPLAEIGQADHALYTWETPSKQRARREHERPAQRPGPSAWIVTAADGHVKHAH
jgi:transcriptional regulator with XRE-family HTH domain